jgi:hypothetical protein
MRCSWALSLVTVVASELSESRAQADFDVQYAVGVDGAWLRHAPVFSTKALGTSARTIGSSEIAPGRGLGLLGVSADIDLTFDDRWRVPIMGSSLAWAIGSDDETVTSLDGSIAHERPWTTFRGDLLLPGFGRRWKHRRYMWSAVARTGVSWLAMRGSVAAGGESVPLDLSAATFLLQVELEGCRRLDPTTRACLQLVPRVYEHEWGSGLTFGFRMEWGR